MRGAAGRPRPLPSSVLDEDRSRARRHAESPLAGHELGNIGDDVVGRPLGLVS